MAHWLDTIGTVKPKKHGQVKHKPGTHPAVKHPEKDDQDPAADLDPNNTTGKVVGYCMIGVLSLILLKGIKEAFR